MICNKCKHEWKYKGASIVYAVCPVCRYNNKIKLGTIKEQQ